MGFQKENYWQIGTRSFDFYVLVHVYRDKSAEVDALKATIEESIREMPADSS